MSVLYTGVSKPFVGAVRNTSTSSHGGSRDPGSASQSSTSTTFSNTTDVRVVGGNGRGSGNVTDSRVVGSRDVGGARDCDRVVSGQCADAVTVTNVLVDLCVSGLTCASGGAVQERNEGRTVGKHTTNFALVDSLLQDVGTVDQTRPAVDEISVETVTTGITLSKDPSSAVVVVWEVLNVVNDFVEQHRQMNRVGRRAGSSIDTSRRPGHVRDMIGRI